MRQNVIIFLIFQLEACYDEHVEYYGKEISMEYPVRNNSMCGDLCLGSPNCVYFGPIFL